MRETRAIIVVRDAALASSLELVVLAGGFTARIFPAATPPADLPLDHAATLIAESGASTPDSLTLIATLRALPWPGRVILLTGDGEALQRDLAGTDDVAVLEMPFLGADLIAALGGGSGGGSGAALT